MLESKKHIDTKTGIKNAGNAGNIFFQPKLSINQPNDVYEQEADATAGKVMQASSSSQQTFFSPPAIQRKEDLNQTAASSQTGNYISSLSGGKALSNEEKTFFE